MSEVPLHTARRTQSAGAQSSRSDEANETIARLAKLSPLDYDRVRQAEAERLGARVTTLDTAVERARPRDNANDGRQGEALTFERPAPWDHAVDGEALYDELEATFTRYLALPKGAAPALALWTLHTYVFDRFAITPRLAVVSAEKGSGKTTVLRLLEHLACKTLLAAHVTPAALFRTLAIAQPTLLIDEADTFMNGNSELRGIINSGHGNDGRLIRNVGDDHEPRKFSTWGPVAIAAIGDLPDTIMDRALVIPMRRRRSDEPVERFRLDRTSALTPLARQCERLAQDTLHKAAALDPACPDWMPDRAADNWRILFAIADTIGERIAAKARAAARALTPTTAAPTDGTMLLEDIRREFNDRATDRIASAELVAALTKREDRPWPEWKHGQPLTTRQLAKLLAPFGVAPTQAREGGRVIRCYDLKDLEDTFARYLPSLSATAVQARQTAALTLISSATRPDSVPDRKPEDANNAAPCTEVPDEPPETPPDLRLRIKPGLRDA